jgi:hypothetical protein
VEPHKYPCGCVLSFERIELDGEEARFELRFDYCDEHQAVEVFVGTDWLRFDLRALPEEEGVSDE